MALHHLLSLIPAELAQTRRDVLARWSETPATGAWDAEPTYGAFVGDDGRVLTGTAPAAATLDSDDPRNLRLLPQTSRGWPTGTKVVFLDWGRQPLSWEEVFELWEAWDSQGMVVACGSVAVAWPLSHRWILPGWIAFQDGFDGEPLATVSGQAAAPSVALALPAAAPAPTPTPPVEPPSGSFLARARKIRGEEPTPASRKPASTWAGEVLPMLPFTLDSLKDPAFAWPSGAA